MVSALSRIMHAGRAAIGAMRSIKPGRIVEPSERGIEIADLFTRDITPATLHPVLHSAAYGDYTQQFALFDRMIETDGHLRSVYNTRKMAIRGLEWELVPASEVGKHPKIDEDGAKSAHEFCAEVLADLDGLDAALAALHDAIGTGIKVVELEWRNQLPVACHVVADCQLAGDSLNPSRLRIMLENDWHGIAVRDYPAGKFIVHAPVLIGGLASRGGLLRVAVLPFCAKRFSVQSWIIFNEVYGQPIAVAKYGAADDDLTRRNLATLLKTLGQNRGGVFPQNCDVQLIEAAARGQLPQERFAAYIDAELSKLFLGQTLTTQIGETGGAMAAAKVHDEVRGDLLADDIKAEGNTIRSQLIVPLCRMKFGDDAARNAPYFRRVVEEARDLLDEAELIDRVVNRLGGKVPKSVIKDQLGIRLVDDENPDEPLPGAVGGDSFQNDLSFNSRRSAASSLVAHRTLSEIVTRRRSSASRLSAWIFAAVLASTAHTANVVGAISTFIEKRRDLETALADLPQVFDELPTDEMRQLEEHFLVASKMAGMADAQLKIGRRGRANTRRASRMAHEEIDLSRIPFVRAIESLRDRIGLTPDQFAGLEREARSRAWRVAGVYDMSLLATIHTALVQSIAAGETSRDFRLRMPAMAAAAGWSGENPWHADLVHFQNFAMAHAAGRYGEYREFGAAGWRFTSNGDACPICEPFINKVFSLDDRKAFPPLHFWCDCEDEVVFAHEVAAFDQSSRIHSAALDEMLAKPSAFKFDPAEYANLEPLKLGGFPEALHSPFRGLAERLNWEIAA